MADDTVLIDAFDARARRRAERRELFRSAFSAAVLGIGAASLAAPAAAQTITDADVLNFALNLEYLEANFYSYAAFGTPITAVSGSGNPGLATGGRKVTFTDAAVSAYAREIAQDEIAHVNFLRTQLGSARVAQPTIDVGISPTGAFSSAARAAGLISATDMTQFFDAYGSDENFLLAAFIFEDVGVTAYKGAAKLISNKTYLEAAAGILAVEAYHAALVRTTLYAKGINTPTLRTSADAISNARDSLDGSSDDDQGISAVTGFNGTQSNIVPLDSNGLAYSRDASAVLNIVFLNKAAVTMGGFFPNGVNGTIKTSGANG